MPPKLEGSHRFYVIVACAQFAVFLGLWLLARRKPKHSLILALIVFWMLPLGVVLMSPGRGVEFPGAFSIILELAFTLALIGGISAAYRAEELAMSRQTHDTAAPDGE